MGGGVIGSTLGFGPSSPGPSPGPPAFGFRPTPMRTCVRGAGCSIYGVRREEGDRGIAFVCRSVAAPRHVCERWQLADAQAVRHRGLGDAGRPLRSARSEPRSAQTQSAIAPALGGDSRRGLLVQPRAAEAAALQGRPEVATVRALRTGRPVAWSSDVVDPRPHQRRPGRQPPREPQDLVPELRGDARHPLRAQREPSEAVCALRRHLHSELRPAAILLEPLWQPIGGEPRRPAGAQTGRAAAIRGVVVGDRGDRLRRGWLQVRGVRQRDPEVGAAVRAGSRVSRGGSVGRLRRPRPSRGGRGRGGRLRASGRSAGGWSRPRGPRGRPA